MQKRSVKQSDNLGYSVKHLNERYDFYQDYLWMDNPDNVRSPLLFFWVNFYFSVCCYPLLKGNTVSFAATLYKLVRTVFFK